MDYSPEAIKNDLVTVSSDVFITRRIIDAVPFAFSKDYDEYIEWRHSLSQELRIDPGDILVTGSAGLGISFNPYKNFGAFNADSDIDVCIISEYFFGIAWHDLIHIKRNNLPNKMAVALNDHRKRLIYYGTIATDKILPLLSFGKLKRVRSLANIIRLQLNIHLA